MMKDLLIHWDNTLRGLNYTFWSKREEYYYGIKKDSFTDTNGLDPNIYNKIYKSLIDFYINNPKDRTKAIIDIIKVIRSGYEYKVVIVLPDDNFFTKDAVELVNLITLDEHISKSTVIIDKMDDKIDISATLDLNYKNIIITNTYDIFDILDRSNSLYFIIDSLEKCHFILGNRATRLINQLSIKVATNEKYSCTLVGDLYELRLCVEKIRHSLYIGKENGLINYPTDLTGMYALMEDLLYKNIGNKLKELAITDCPILEYTDKFSKGLINYKLKDYSDDKLSLEITFVPMSIFNSDKKKESVEKIDPNEKLEEIRKNLILEYEELTENNKSNYKGRAYLASMIESISISIK